MRVSTLELVAVSHELAGWYEPGVGYLPLELVAYLECLKPMSFQVGSTLELIADFINHYSLLTNYKT